MSRVSGKVALVTGASSGIGEAVAVAFAEAGMKLVLAARRKDRLDALAARIGGDVLAVETDVTSETSVRALFVAAIDRFGRIDILINNAGVADATPTDELSLEGWSRVIDTNLTGCFLCAREALRAMKRQGRGRIVNIGSLSAKVPRPDSAAYTASKFALEGLTRSIAVDFREHGIAVSIFHPGMVVTELAPGMTDADPKLMSDAADTARAILTMVDMPDNVNFFEGLMVPLEVPFLGRG